MAASNSCIIVKTQPRITLRIAFIKQNEQATAMSALKEQHY